MSELQKRYSGGAILLHWLIALALAAQLALGFAMPKDASGFQLYQLHKSIGMAILLLSLARLAWRWRMGPGKRPPPAETGITGALARAVHIGFYVVMIAMPLTGWVLVSTARIDVPTVLFGTIPLPHLPLPDSLEEIAEESHELLAWGGIGLFVLHVAGALRHQFLLKDRLLARMSPGGSGVFAMIMGGVVVMLGLLVFVRVGNDDADRRNVELAQGESIDDEAFRVTEEAPLSSPTDEPTPDAEETAAAQEEEEQANAESEGEDAESDTAEAAAEAATPTPTSTAGPAPQWTIQPGGNLRFSVVNAGSAINGSFARWNGTIAMDPANPQTARIRIEIDLASATLGDSTQDRMLRGAEFLGAGSNPTAVWRSLVVRSLGGGRYEADGTLSLKGASRPQQIRFTLTGEGAQRQVQGSATIDRNAFAVGTGENAANLGANVRVNFSFSARR